MLFPPMCGDWVHFPIDIPDNDPGWADLYRLGFVKDGFCEKNDRSWRHVSMPAKWLYAIDSDGDAVIKDEKKRTRVIIVTSGVQEECATNNKETTTPDNQNIGAYMEVYRYYLLRIGRYQEDGQGFIFFELHAPDGYVIYDAFETVPLNTRFNIKPLIQRLYSMARVLYPEITDPLAYWDTSP